MRHGDILVLHLPLVLIEYNIVLFNQKLVLSIKFRFFAIILTSKTFHIGYIGS